MAAQIQRRTLLGAALAASVLGSFGAAHADGASDYPNRAVNLVVPFSPGGSTDIIARRLAEEMSKELGQPFVVENLGGADGALGAGRVARAKPDGYTLLYGNASTMTIAPVLKKTIDYHPTKTFEPIGEAVQYPLIFVANPNKPFKTFAEFLEYAKANPGVVNAASSSTGGYMATAVLMLETGTDMAIIPYSGGGPVMLDLISGQVDVAFGSTGTTLPNIESGQLIALAVADDERFPPLPDTPTIAESGYPEFQAGSWNGLFAPKGTPSEIVDKLNAALSAALATPEAAGTLEDLGMTATATTPSEFTTFLDGEIARWESVVNSGKVKVPGE